MNRIDTKMKNLLLPVLMGLAVLALFSCEPLATEKEVQFTVSYIWWSNEDGVEDYLDEVRIVGSFNNWGDSSAETTVEQDWSNSMPMTWNSSTERFEGTITLPIGDLVEYKFIGLTRNRDNDEPYFFGWLDPSWMRYNSGTYAFSPMDRLVSDGFGGNNVEYTVE